LKTEGFAQLDPRNFGNCVPLIGGLQRTRQQRIFVHRLWRLPRIDAGRTKEKQLFDVILMRGLNDVRLDHQIVIDEFGRSRVVGVDAAHCRRRENTYSGRLSATQRSHPADDAGPHPENQP